MPSGTTRARVTCCCSLVIRISATSRSLFNAGSDWVGSCAITIKWRRDRTPKGSIPELRFCAMRLGNRGSRGSRFATRRPNSASGKLDRPVKYRFFRRCDILAIRDAAGVEVLDHAHQVRERTPQSVELEAGALLQGSMCLVQHRAIMPGTGGLLHEDVSIFHSEPSPLQDTGH